MPGKFTELLQIHWQFKDRTEMRAQREITSHDELVKFADETKKDYPLPDGARWLFVPESSRHFVMTHAKVKNAGD